MRRSLNFLDVEPSGISTDSRSIREGELFVAVRGYSADGHEYVTQAIDSGACALVVDRPASSSLPEIVVENTAIAAALLAKKFFGDPASKLLLVGITGTNGKTSTSFLVRSILERALGPAGIIGTVGFGAAGELMAATHTTPASVDLYRILSDFLAKGCRAVVMEVSSHAADQGRITGLEFDVGVFTNITRDHLDYHGTFENYVRAKEMFATTLLEGGRRKGPGRLVYNLDDPVLGKIGDRFDGDKITFGLGPAAAVRGERLRADLEGTQFDLGIGDGGIAVDLKLRGRFSVYNALAAASAAHSLGIGLDEIKEGLERIQSIPGRFEVVSSGRGPTVVVDYAHTPDALDNLLRFCRELSAGRVLTVFGCGGDRDRGKRPLMGRIAVELSDAVYVTNDNPRSENPDDIIDEILQGTKGSKTSVRVIEDRREAIGKAVRDANADDLVVLAGKGHENVQIVGENRIPFSDVEEAEKALEDSGGRISRPS